MTLSSCRSLKETLVLRVRGGMSVVHCGGPVQAGPPERGGGDGGEDSKPAR
jgi:hypothetical protein